MQYDASRPLPSAPEALFAHSGGEAESPATRKVLIIEDNPLNQKLFRDLVLSRGYDALCAADGLEGLAACLSHCPDLVLLDVQLPGLGGADVARAISAAPNPPRIIAISAFAGEAEAARLRAAGCADCLPKPVAINDFFSRIDRALGEEN